MKPFNLERALAGDPVGTRDGKHKAVHIFHADKGAEICKVIAVFDDGIVAHYHENGCRYTEQCPGDLVMLTQTPYQETERKEFEEHMFRNYSPPEDDFQREFDGRYVRGYFEDHWITWKAARGVNG